MLSERTPPLPLDAATRDAPIGRTGRGGGFESLGQTASPVRVGRIGRTLPVVTGDRQVQLDYEDVDVVRVAREVVGDVLGLTVTVDPGVQGRITLRTGGRVPLTEIPRRLDEALQPLGYGIAAVSGRVRVGRIADLESPGSGAETRLIPLQSVAPGDILPVLQQNLPDGVRLQADPAGRGLLATGQAAAIDAMQELVRLFDVDTLRSRSFGLYPLANAAPAAVLRELGAIYGGAGVRFAAIERLNAILVVADRPGALTRVRQTLVQLDTAAEATANVHVYPVRFRRATDLADILSRTFGGVIGPPPVQSGPAGSFGGLSVGSSAGNPSALGTRVPGAAAGLPDAVPDAPQPSLQAAPQAPSLTSAELGLGGPVRVQADAGRNALVVLASPSDYAIVEQTIRRLDVRPRQVFLEAIIAEVTLNDTLRYGIDASLRLGSGNLSQGNPFNLLAPLTGGLAYVIRDANVTLTLQALSAITDVKVVSAPRVLVLDNETATLQVGNQVPILVRSSQSTQNGNAPIVDSVELRDTGVILAVRARIGAGGSVSMDVFQEVSNAVVTDSSNLNSPTIQLRRLQSAIAVQSGDTVALGGLLKDQSVRRRTGIPFLSSLPFVGALFGTREQVVDRSELLVLLTPRVVEDGFDTRSLTDELRSKLGALAPDLADSITPPPPGFRPEGAPPRGVRVVR